MDVHTPDRRQKNMAAIKGKDTKPELLVRRGLHRLGYRYRLHSRSLPGTPDLVFPGRRKVIFVNGCFWHSHDCRYGRVVSATRPEFWAQKRAATVERDSRNNAALATAGWRVLTIWECELRKGDKVIAEAVEFLEH